jgi:hypothetical protein
MAGEAAKAHRLKMEQETRRKQKIRASRTAALRAAGEREQAKIDGQQAKLKAEFLARQEKRAA